MKTKSEGFICFDIEKWPWKPKLHDFCKIYEDDLNVISKQWPKIQILDGLYYLSHWVVRNSGADKILAFLKFKDLLN